MKELKTKALELKSKKDQLITELDLTKKIIDEKMLIAECSVGDLILESVSEEVLTNLDE